MVYCSVAAVLKFLLIFEQRALYSHFELRSANYVAAPRLCNGQGSPNSGSGALETPQLASLSLPHPERTERARPSQEVGS